MAKKIIKKSDIKKMNLTEDELYYIEDIAEDINKGAAYESAFTSFFQFGTIIKDERTAILKCLEYFTLKTLAETNSNDFEEVSKYLADNIFFTYTEGIKCYLRGMSCNWDSKIIVNDVFGLNYISIK